MTLTTERVDRKFIHQPREEEVPKTADVVIIGGGMAGPAAAWAIEKAAPGTTTVVVEKNDDIAGGASTASIENFRTCWPTPCLASMMMRSAEIFLNADEYFGEGASQRLGIKQRGYLYCGFNDKDAESLKSDVDYLREIGLPHVEFLDEDEVASRYPWLGGRVVAAKFDPIAGWLDSNALSHLYAQTGTDSKFLLGIKETKILTVGNRVAGVETPNGTISTPNVVIAAGPGSREIGRSAGIDLPIVVRPRQSFTSSYRHSEFPENSPFIIAASPASYVRPEAGTGTIFGWEYHIRTNERVSGTEDFISLPDGPADRYKDQRFPSMLLKTLSDQFRYVEGEGFSNPNYLRGVNQRAGYYVYRSPEFTTTKNSNGETIRCDSERAIIDAYPGIDGLFLSVAHVGHGIMASPTAGEILSAHILGQEQSDPLFYQFGINVNFVEHDGGGL